MNIDAAAVMSPSAGGFRVDDLVIHVSVRRVTRNGVDLDISGRSFDLLLALVRTAPNLMSMQELMDCVWPRVIVGPEAVTQSIMRLRQSLGDSAENPRYIAAVRGHGYRVVAEVAALAVSPISPSRVAVDTQEPSPRKPEAAAVAPTQAPASTARISRWNPVLLVLALLLGAGILLWWGFGHRGVDRLADSSGTRPELPAIQRLSVAVLPFANLTGDSGKDYFSDGMAAELINSLTQVPGLKVPARTSSFAYKGRNADIRGIANDLGVAMILEGSVRSAGEHVRVTAELVDARSGYHLWSQSYDRQMADIFKLQDELATAIIAALQQHLGAAIAVPVARVPPTSDVEAYRLFLQAEGTAKGTPATVRLALPLIDQALARDPNFAPALADRAEFRTGMALLGETAPETVDDAARDAKRALALSPGLARAHSALAYVHFAHGDWTKSEMSYQAALATAGDDARIHTWYAFILLAGVGRLQRAQTEASEAYRLAPADPFVENVLADADLALGLDAEAARLSELAVEIGRPRVGSQFLAYADLAARKGQYAEAAARALQALPAQPTALRGDGGEALKLFYGALADPTRAPAARRALQALMPQLLSETIDPRISSYFVIALTRLDALDSAYELANGLVAGGKRLHISARGDLDLACLWFPEMRRFRQDPRFQDLVTRLKLIDYWKQFGPPDNCELQGDKLFCR
jgi:TolB-like protein/DNA-binding winged helix-turn-helix (wHTH) protein/Tfp pilus assembly protein PilF